MFVSKHVDFLEKEFLLRDSGSKIKLEGVHRDEVAADPSEAQALCRSSRIKTVLERYGFLIIEQKDVLFIEDDESTTYKEYLNSSEFNKWLVAIKSKMDSMYENQVWTLVDPPKEIKPIGHKWVFKKKTDMEGNVITYKARLVAKGYCQRQEIYNDKTFSPVAMLNSIRILLAIATHYNYEIWKMDVKITFLNGNLTEDVYMTQPEGFTSKDGNKVYKLQRSIYGLKQTSRSWNNQLDETIKGFGFSQNQDEACVCTNVSGSVVVVLILHVDDILLMRNDVLVLQSIKIWLSKNFSMKDLREAIYD